MAKKDWALIRELSTALGRANTPRMVPKTIGEGLEAAWSIRGVRLLLVTGGKRSDDLRCEIFEAAYSRGRWATEKSSRRRPPARGAEPTLSENSTGMQLTLPLRLGRSHGELRCRFGRGGNSVLGDSTYLATLAHLVSVGIENQQLILRVADLSRSAYEQNRELRLRLEDTDSPSFVARSAEMREVVARIGMVARYDTAVLVSGESGVGKELVAREIHRRSPRSRRPFVQLNCGAIPGQLVESELFGHEKGAFTGAERTHRGVFEQADGGVLLLDEVGDLPLAAQVKLLRVLQEGRVRRVGAESEIEVNVRVVAATHRGLEEMVALGSFRADLYFRLSVFPIEVVPLRERPLDIPPLIHALIGTLSGKLDIARPRVTTATLARLTQHTWPGNVRELANVLEAAMILGGGRELELPPRFGSERRPEAAANSAEVRSLEQVIKDGIEAALRRTNGKIYGDDGAAAALSLHPATLQSKMRKLGIRRAVFVAEAGR